MPRALSAARRHAEGDGIGPRTRPHAPCAHCGRVRPVAARGLCAGCYRTVRDRYPTQPRGRHKHRRDSDADRAAKEARLRLYKRQAAVGELDFGAPA